MGDEEIKTVQQAFEKFEKDTVRVPSEQNEAAKIVHQEIRATISRELPEYDKSFLSGSYSRKVQAVRLKDIDIILVLNDPEGRFAASANSALEAIQNVARESGLVRRTRKGVRSVKLILNDFDFTIDLVAALDLMDGTERLRLARYMPDRGLDDWTLENPHGQLAASIKKNGECGGIYIPSVRLVKYWLGRIWGDQHRSLKSYHAESILYGSLHSKLEYADVITNFFSAAYQVLAPGILTPDPGAPNHYVDELLEDSERAVARSAVDRARKAAYAAVDKQNVEEALNAWVEVFGSAFPSPSTSPASIAASLATHTARVAGIGIQVGKGREIMEARSWGKIYPTR